MCGITGASNKDTVDTLVQHLQHRGRESTVTVNSEFALGHVLHPVVGHVEQPLEGDGTLVANCEIYNWQELADRYDYDAANDADLLLRMLDDHGTDALDELDGVYAFAYQRDGELVLARDMLGLKPLWYADPAVHDTFVFASERQALEQAGYTARALHPRHILRYDIDTNNITTEQRGFFTINEDTEQTLDEAVDGVKQRFRAAVEKRVPDTEVGLLFSAGVDSTLTAVMLQELGVDVTCYTAGIQHGNVNRPKDVVWAEQVADQLGLDLHVQMMTLDDVKKMLPDIVDWTSSTSVVDAGVALSFHFALGETPESVSASQNISDVRVDEPVVFSGMGSEQLYAGYSRQQGYLNKECLSSLRRMWQDDLYRDDVITMRNGTELRLPFLDHDLIRHALTIPGDWKVEDGYRKYVLRKAAEALGVPADVAWRGKKAAQYGSNFDKALSRLAKNADCRGKQAYLCQYRDSDSPQACSDRRNRTGTVSSRPDRRLAALTSGGKDSNAALYRMLRRNNEIRCLINLQSRNDASYMFDTKERDIVKEQSERLDIPMLVQDTAGKKESELDDLAAALQQAKQEYAVEGVVAGALASTYQRDRVEQVADQVGLQVFAPLWQEDPAAYMQWLVRTGFEIQITETAARGLDDSWTGTVLDENSVEDLIALSEEYRFNAAGEGGEYETVVTGYPDNIDRYL